MIVPRSLAVPLALLVALTTTTLVYNAGIAEAPTRFFGGEDVIVIGPPANAVPGEAAVDVSRARALAALPSVLEVSPETFSLVELGGRSAFVRGVDFAPFLRIEGATLVAGRLPEGPREALAGVGFADKFSVGPGSDVVIPASFDRLVIPLRVVGIVTMSGPAQDELLVSLADGRTLQGLAPEDGHLLRITSNDTARTLALLNAVGPTFTYSHVELTSSEVVPGEPTSLTAELTNWGTVGGTKLVQVRSGENVIAERPFFVEARSTIPIRVDFVLDAIGATNVTVNPTLPVTVRAPSLRIVAPSVAASGELFQVTVTDLSGAPVADIPLLAAGREAITDVQGRAELVAGAPGAMRILALRGGSVEGAASLHVPALGFENAPQIRVIGLQMREEIVGTSHPFNVSVMIENVGGAYGERTIDIMLDGEPYTALLLAAAPGETRVVAPIAVGPTDAGEHHLGIRGERIGLAFHAYPGDDPRIEAILQGYEARRSTPGAVQDADEAHDYVSQIVGGVREAVVFLTLTSAALATLCAVMVMRRHMAEREGRIGILKGIGASAARIQGIAAREALIVGVVAAAAGIAGGLVMAHLLDLSGYVWGFGHAIHPAYQWHMLGLIFIFAVAAVTLSVVGLVRAALRLPADVLLRGRETRPAPPSPPTLDARWPGGP